MIHENRRFQVTDLTELPLADFADQVVNYSHVLCQGFRYHDLLFLNDSFTEDSAQEFAVLHDDQQIESLTASWMTPETFAELTTKYLAGDGLEPSLPINVRTHQEGPCRLCA